MFSTVRRLGMFSFMVFEIEELMKMSDQNLLPIIMYIFHHIESALDSSPAVDLVFVAMK